MNKPANNSVDAFVILDQIRKLLGLSIDQFCFEMNWPHSSYYDMIRQGIKRPDGTRKPSSPTVNKIFDGINYAIATYPHWTEHKEEITFIVTKELIK